MAPSRGTAAACAACLALFALPPLPATARAQPAALPDVVSHMSESLREEVGSIVVLPTESPPEYSIGGSYRKKTDGLAGGIVTGAQIGNGISTDVAGIPISIPFPILTLPGALVGGIAGATKREIQEFRDALATELSEASSQPLTNDALASDVFWQLRDVRDLTSKLLNPDAEMPADVDAILFVSFRDMTIDVEGKDAVIAITANATLHRLSDGRHLYSRNVSYQDRDTLANWTRDDNVLWRNYSNYARHFIGREIAAEIFKVVRLNHALEPRPGADTKRVKRDDWHIESRSRRPTLAWDLELLGGDLYGSWAILIDPADIRYDVEIYDSRRLVYSASQLPDTQHAIGVELEPCGKYRWSVRPVYLVGGDIKFGEWMRADGGAATLGGSRGRQASVAPAYTYDFARLEIDCRSR